MITLGDRVITVPQSHWRNHSLVDIWYIYSTLMWDPSDLLGWNIPSWKAFLFEALHLKSMSSIFFWFSSETIIVSMTVTQHPSLHMGILASPQKKILELLWWGNYWISLWKRMDKAWFAFTNMFLHSSFEFCTGSLESFTVMPISTFLFTYKSGFLWPAYFWLLKFLCATVDAV